MFGYWPMGGMLWFWLLLLGCGFWFWGYRPRYYPRRYRYYRYHDDPFEITRARLAKGDITIQEYEEIMSTLKQENARAS
jgi:uncharacterized membrane protein